MILNIEWFNNEIKEEIEEYLKTNDNNNMTPKIYGTQPKQF